MKSRDETRELIGEAQKHFLIPRKHFDVQRSVDMTLAELDGARERLPAKYRAVVDAFRHNMASTISTVSIPYSLASASVIQSHFQRIHIAERIRAQTYGDLFTEDAAGVLHHPEEEEKVARSRADSRMLEFVQTDEGVETLVRDTASFLLDSLKRGTEHATREILNQGILLLWSAFEVLCRDIFETLLNADPAKVKMLLDDPVTRRRFEPERLSLETLLLHDFDLSVSLGTVLVTRRDFSDLPTIKAVYSVLFPKCGELLQALSHRNLWTLFQQRHLVVHKRCVIDQSYLDATGEDLPVGALLNIAPRDFERAFNVVTPAAVAIARCISTTDLP